MVLCTPVKGAAPINYRLKSEVYPLHFVVSYVQPVTQQYKSRELLENYLCNQSSHYEKYGRCRTPLLSESEVSITLLYQLCCHLDYTSQFTFDICYTKGYDNPVADALSCVEVNALHIDTVIDLKEMAAAQQTDRVNVLH